MKQVYAIEESLLTGKCRIVYAEVTKETDGYIYTERAGLSFGCMKRHERAFVHFSARQAVDAFRRRKELELEGLKKRAQRAREAAEWASDQLAMGDL